MKKSIFILIAQLVISLTVVAQQPFFKSPFNDKDSIQINGKIIGYEPNQEDHFITFSTYDLFGRQVNMAVQIENNGSFWIKLHQPFEGDMQLNYKDAYLNLYTKAGIPLTLEIYNEKVDKTRNFENAFVAKGELAEVNNLMFKFANELARQNIAYVEQDKTLIDSLMALKYISALNEKLKFLTRFIEKNKITNNLFIDWQKNHLQYAAAKEILFFPFMGKMNTEISSAQLLELIKPIAINNPTAFHNSAYYEFLSMLVSGQQIIINLNPSYEKKKKELVGNTMGLSLDLIDSYAKGLTKQLLYYISYYRKGSATANPTIFLTRFNEVITDPILAAAIKPDQKHIENFKAYNIVDRLTELNVNEELKQRLINIFIAYKGTNLYLDFWGDWCGPCMSELPNYPRLISALAGKSIKFVFLSAFTTEESMLSIKEKFKINGDFINLSKDEVAIMNNVFEFHSYPSHFIVDQKGLVLKESYKFSNSGIGDKAAEIDKLLTVAKK